MTVGSGLGMSPSEVRPDRFAQTIRQLIEGRSNAVGSVTLTTAATSTTVTANTCSPTSAVFLFPTTAAAAGLVATTFIASTDVTARQFIIHHASSTSTRLNFVYACIG